MNRLFSLIVQAIVSLWLSLLAFTSFTVALVLAALGFAFAQDAAPVVGGVQVPSAVWEIAGIAIGWLVKEIASPLTSLLKKRIGFQGDTTRYVYIVLSAAFVAGFGLFTHAFASGPAGWWAALFAYLVAIIKGFGDYQTRVNAAKAGGSLPVIVGDVLPPAGVIEAPAQPVAPSGIEALPVAHGLLSLPTLTLDSVIEQLLAGAFKGALPLGFAGKFALQLAPIIPELLDGDLYLSAPGRNRILDVILDAKAAL